MDNRGSYAPDLVSLCDRYTINVRNLFTLIFLGDHMKIQAQLISLALSLLPISALAEKPVCNSLSNWAPGLFKCKSQDDAYLESQFKQIQERQSACRRNMGSCSQSDTCGVALPSNLSAEADAQERCRRAWQAATARSRGIDRCEQHTSRTLYENCMNDLR